MCETADVARKSKVYESQCRHYYEEWVAAHPIGQETTDFYPDYEPAISDMRGVCVHVGQDLSSTLLPAGATHGSVFWTNRNYASLCKDFDHVCYCVRAPPSAPPPLPPPPPTRPPPPTSPPPASPPPTSPPPPTFPPPESPPSLPAPPSPPVPLPPIGAEEDFVCETAAVATASRVYETECRHYYETFIGAAPTKFMRK